VYISQQVHEEEYFMLRHTIKAACRLNSRCSGLKRSLWKRLAARTIHKLTFLFIEPAIRIVGHTRKDSAAMDKIASGIAGSGMSQREFIGKLTAYVNKDIEYWPMNRWLHPSHVLRLGIGDCKNQAALLQAIFERCGIESELTVGVTNRLANESDVHAWVRVWVDDSIFICDPVTSAKPVGASEYERMVRGLIDITPEYLLKEPVSALYGVGKLSCLENFADGVKQSHGINISAKSQ